MRLQVQGFLTLDPTLIVSTPEGLGLQQPANDSESEQPLSVPYPNLLSQNTPISFDPEFQPILEH
jgi:hypothetical protein